MLFKLVRSKIRMLEMKTEMNTEPKKRENKNERDLEKCAIKVSNKIHLRT